MLTLRERRYLENYRNELDTIEQSYFDSFNEYLEAHCNYRPRTILQYLREYRTFVQTTKSPTVSQEAVDMYFSSRPKTSVRRGMVRQLIEWRAHLLKHPVGSDYEHMSENKRMQLRSEMRLIEIPQVRQSRVKEPKQLTDEQVESWLERLKKDDTLPKWYLPIVLLLVDSGARIGEVLSLRRKDIKEDRISTCTKGGLIREKRLRPQTIQFLQEFSKEKGQNDLIFNDENKTDDELHPSKVRYYFQKYASAEGVHPMMLRRYVATKMHRLHVETIIIRDVLGHKHVQTTQSYVETETSQVSDAIDKYHNSLR